MVLFNSDLLRNDDMNQNDLAVILTCPLFQGLDTPGLLLDLQSLSYRMTTYDAGQAVLFRNDPFNELLIIVDGFVEAYQEDSDGHQLIVETLNTPEAVATPMLFTPDPRIPVSLTAGNPCKIYAISRSSLLRLCGRYPKLLENLLNDMGIRAAFLANKLRFQTFTSIKQKLAVFLREQLDQGKSEITVNKEHLSELFGVNRPSLSRVCRELSDQGIIRLDGRRLLILDSDAVTTLAETL